MRAIDIIDVSKIYQSKKDAKQALKEINLHVKYGEIVSLLGSNGAGKTTTLNIISGFINVSCGEAFVDGKKINEELYDIRKKIGYLTPGMSLYKNLSIKESIHFLADLRNVDKETIKERKEFLWDTFNFGEFEDRSFDKLSSGQQQKSLIAAAVIHDPDILIFDEVTASLDVLACKEVMNFIRSEKERGKAILFSTHILSEAEFLSDRIVVIHDGEIIEEATSNEFQSRYNVTSLYEAFVNSVEKHTQDKKKKVA